jgi:hypothetical protein
MNLTAPEKNTILLLLFWKSRNNGPNRLFVQSGR